MDDDKWHPGKLLQLSGFYWKSCTLHAGVKLDIFTTIGNKKLTADDISKKISGSLRGVKPLLNALTGMKLLNKEDDFYLNTSESKTFLSKESNKYIGFMIMHHHHLSEGWVKLDQAVLSGEPVRKRASFANEEVRESFLMGMFNTAMGIAPLIIPHVDLTDKKKLLDLGGGPGTYAIHFCMENSSLRASVFDLPTTRPFAEKTIEKFSLTDRINFMEGDFIEDEIKGSYDVAWLSHILHSDGFDNCKKIIKKAVSALEPGGKIIIHEFILNNNMDSPEFPTLFSLNMLLGTENGQSYSENELTEMLKSSGVKNIERIIPDVPNDSSLLVGTV